MDGKRIRKWHSGYRTRREAEDARIEILARIQKGAYIQPAKTTLEAFLGHWLEAKVGTIKENTHAAYRNDLRAYVIPRLGSRRLQNLQPGELNGLYADLRSNGGRSHNGLSAKTIRNIHGVIHKALADAARWGFVARNVADLADPPSAEKPELRTWTAAQGRVFLGFVADDRLAALWRLLATTGMRRSEVLGIRWGSLDFNRATVAVRDTVAMVNNKPTLRIGVTKSESSARLIALDQATIAALRTHRAQQLEERMLAGSLWSDLELVFCREDGSIIPPDWLTRRAKSLVEAAGLPWVGLHSGLRHGWATWALEAGVPAKVVQERLGHSSIAITLDRYSHLVEGMDREAAEKVAEVL